MQVTVISDTSCLIILEKIGQVHLLKKLYSQVFITKTVAEEFGRELPDFIKIKLPSEKNIKEVSSANIDFGEISAIALALDFENSLLIVDDMKARNVAISFGIKTSGSLGVLIEAKKSGHIRIVKTFIEQISKTDFRLSEDLIKAALKLADE